MTNFLPAWINILITKAYWNKSPRRHVREEVFYREGGERLQQVAQRGEKAPGNPWKSVEKLKGRLDGARRNLIELKMSLFTAVGLD